MDKAQLAEAGARKAAQSGQGILPEDAERVIDALFGTVDSAGVIAEGLKDGETVAVGSFGRFRADGGSAVFEPGRALTEYLHGDTR
jgi:nucleoid DNA-binding protein